ncbi:MAG: acetate--CoA ligase family protein, partial [SAR324 cluster bacterium]|nr:acetate--CoA ligase family protein [SAR324 cluster bacterium]
AFMSAAREVALSKPIIIIKPGRTAAAAKAAASHTGSLTGSDDVLDAAFRRCGVLRVDSISELFSMADILGKQPRPKGPNLSIVTNAGGPGVIASDAVILNGGKLADISPEIMAELNTFLPAAWSHNNPIDVIGDASPERYSKAVEVAAKDPNTDGLLVVLTPQAMTDPTQTAEQIKQHANIGKPVLASWMGGAESKAGEQILSRANIPCFDAPDTAARLFCFMWKYAENLKSLYETPILSAGGDETGADIAEATAIIEQARKEGRDLLTEFESKKVLGAYKIPIVETIIAETREAAIDAANKLGYPVVLKLHSETITHKTDVGGVQLNLKNSDAVGIAFDAIKESLTAKVGTHAENGQPHFLGVTVQTMINLSDGYEIILGCNTDPQLGPVLLFGTGGQLVEVFKDSSLGLPPLNTTLARRMMERTKIYKALKGVRGRKPVDMVALEQLLVRFSQLVCDQRLIKEIDINPLLVSSDKIVALDARVVLLDPKNPKAESSPLAIRPYPSQFVRKVELKTGEKVTIRPIRPEDEPLVKQFHETLSEQSVLRRYLQP